MSDNDVEVEHKGHKFSIHVSDKAIRHAEIVCREFVNLDKIDADKEPGKAKAVKDLLRRETNDLRREMVTQNQDTLRQNDDDHISVPTILADATNQVLCDVAQHNGFALVPVMNEQGKLVFHTAKGHG